MAKNRKKFSGLAGGACALLLMSCGADDAQHSELSGTAAQLVAAKGSFAAATSAAHACFDAYHSCEQAADKGDGSCRTQLKACLPARPPLPTGCSATGTTGGASADAGASHFPGPGSWTGSAADNASNNHGNKCNTGGPGGQIGGGKLGGTSIPGGTGFPGGTALPGGTGSPGGTGIPGGSGSPGGTQEPPPVSPPAKTPDAGMPPTEVPPSETPPAETPDAGTPSDTPPAEEPPVVLESISQGTCVPPALPSGALSSCAEHAAGDLARGGRPGDAATATFGCIAKTFEDEIGKLCDKAEQLCGTSGAPAELCTSITSICDALSAAGK